MDIIELTRELGKKIQEDERYLKLRIASQNNDEDKDLQELIGTFNLKRININNEISKPERDDDKINRLNNELKECYQKIMDNKNMANYNKAKTEFDTFIKRINSIIIGCANGEDPLTVDVLNSSCSGDCSGCAGCD